MQRGRCDASTKGGAIKTSFLLAKCVVQLKGTCNHLGNQSALTLGSLNLFIIWTPDKIQMF